MPKSLSRIVMGVAVPQRWSTWTRVEKKYTSLLKGELNFLSQFIRYVRIGSVLVFSVYRPGPKISATLPSLMNAAIWDSRTVSLPPF